MGERPSPDESEFRASANKDFFLRPSFPIHGSIAVNHISTAHIHQIRHEACHKFPQAGKKPNR